MDAAIAFSVAQAALEISPPEEEGSEKEPERQKRLPGRSGAAGTRSSTLGRRGGRAGGAADVAVEGRRANSARHTQIVWR